MEEYKAIEYVERKEYKMLNVYVFEDKYMMNIQKRLKDIIRNCRKQDIVHCQTILDSSGELSCLLIIDEH